jgi:hypothetical protein
LNAPAARAIARAGIPPDERKPKPGSSFTEEPLEKMREKQMSEFGPSVSCW